MSSASPTAKMRGAGYEEHPDLANRLKRGKRDHDGQEHGHASEERGRLPVPAVFPRVCHVAQTTGGQATERCQQQRETESDQGVRGSTYHTEASTILSDEVVPSLASQ